MLPVTPVINLQMHQDIGFGGDNRVEVIRFNHLGGQHSHTNKMSPYQRWQTIPQLLYSSWLSAAPSHTTLWWQLLLETALPSCQKLRSLPPNILQHRHNVCSCVDLTHLDTASPWVVLQPSLLLRGELRGGRQEVARFKTASEQPEVSSS